MGVVRLLVLKERFGAGESERECGGVKRGCCDGKFTDGE